MTYSSSSPVVTTTSIILCFNKHRLTQVHLEDGRQKGERETQCMYQQSPELTIWQIFSLYDCTIPATIPRHAAFTNKQLSQSTLSTT